MKSFISRCVRKSDLRLVLLISFIGLTIWLSYNIKKQHVTNKHLKSSLEKTRMDDFLLHNRVHLLNDVLMDNIELKGKKLSGTAIELITQTLIQPGLAPVLYLRAYSCEDCYRNIITSIIDRLSRKKGFHIISHSSNRHYIEEMVQINVINDLSIVLWDDEELFSNSLTNSSAELVLVDNQQRIKALLPLNFFLDPYLFSTYLAWIESGLDGKSLAENDYE
jgi:hypothetical protein